MKLAREVWALLDRRQHRALIGMLIVSIMAAFSTVGGIAAVVPFLAALSDPQLLESHAAIVWLRDLFGVNDRDQMLALLGCGLLLAVLASNFISMFALIAAEKFSHTIAGELQLSLFEEYLRREWGFHAASDSATLTTNITQEVHRLTNGIIYGGLLLLTNAISSALIICAVIVVNPKVALIATLALGGTYLVIYLNARRRLAANGRMLTRMWDERARLVKESFGAVKELLLLHNQKFFSARFREQTQAIGQAQVSVAAISQSPKYILECVTVACLVGAALWLRRGSDSGAWLVQLAFFGMAAYRLLPALQNSFAHAARIRASRAGLEKIAHDLRRASRANASAAQVPAADPAWRQRPRHSIAVRNVTHRYSAERPPALHDLSLEIAAGSFVALIGPNGSGKTTLADVILGLVRPQEGLVEIDGIELDDANLPSWQSAAAYVPQSTFLLNASLAENIALGTARDDIDAATLREAVSLAQLDGFVASLPRGIDEPLGEHGSRLSGGQRQRVGIARALYRRPSLLVLDEATSALDRDAERELVGVLGRLCGERTIILIAHRPSSVRLCHRIFELEHGSLVCADIAV
jgi:HlyD family secretion protein